MKLNSVRICNFRSIKDQTIQFKHNCMVLVGENEAGKSNALKAIAGGLNQEVYPFTAKDKRKVLAGEALPNKNEYYIKYTFSLPVDEMIRIVSRISTDPNSPIINKNRRSLSLRQYCTEYLTQINYVFDILTAQGELYFAEEERSGDPFALTRALSVSVGPRKSKGPDTVETGTSGILSVTDKDTNSKEVGSKDLLQIIKNEVALYFHKNKTGVVFWNYSDTLILPDSIPISTFRSSPAVSVPLRNIFELAMVSDIDQAFKDAEETDGDYENLLERVSVVATRKFAKKWPHLKGTKILVSSDGDLLRIKMQERAKYNFSERSDGFKRFVSILLMLSAQVDTGKIANKLLVIDEPDNSLYPSGARHLRDELLKISEKNLVLYSTHSPFMVDRERLDRHVIVTKTKDVTQFKETKNSMYIKDEVLLHAVGTSIFEQLRPNNLLFEGWSDHCIFQTAISKKNNKNVGLYKNFKDVGTAYVCDTSSFRQITPIIQLARKNIFIFSSSDTSATSARNSYQREKGYQSENWYTIEDLGGGNDQTVEDYLYDSFLQLGLDETLGQGKRSIDKKGNRPVMKFLCDLTKAQKDRLRAYYSENVKPADIKPSYFDLLQNLWEKISSFPAAIS